MTYLGVTWPWFDTVISQIISVVRKILITCFVCEDFNDQVVAYKNDMAVAVQSFDTNSMVPSWTVTRLDQLSH